MLSWDSETSTARHKGLRNICGILQNKRQDIIQLVKDHPALEFGARICQTHDGKVFLSEPTMGSDSAVIHESDCPVDSSKTVGSIHAHPPSEKIGREGEIFTARDLLNGIENKEISCLIKTKEAEVICVDSGNIESSFERVANLMNALHIEEGKSMEQTGAELARKQILNPNGRPIKERVRELHDDYIGKAIDGLPQCKISF